MNDSWCFKVDKVKKEKKVETMNMSWYYQRLIETMDDSLC